MRPARLFEWVVLAIVIAVIVVVGLGYYEKYAEQMQRANARMQVNVFNSYLAVLRGQWLIAGQPETVVMEGVVFAMSPTGWPYQAAEAVATMPQESQETACASLWVAMHPLRSGRKTVDLAVDYGVAVEQMKPKVSVGKNNWICVYRFLASPTVKPALIYSTTHGIVTQPAG